MGDCSPIGVFDSGLGGISVLKSMMRLLPQEHFIYFGDSRRAPYGPKSIDTVRAYSDEIVELMINKGAKAVVIACNTATSAAADFLRSKYPIPIIGVEPALKPAAIAHPNGHILVLATEMTLREQKFDKLMKQFQMSNKISTLAVPEFVSLVDRGITEGPQITEVLNRYFSDVNLSDIQGIVLGCTHYVFLKPPIIEYFHNRVHLYDGNEGTARQLLQVLRSTNQLCEEGDGSATLLNSRGEDMVCRSYELLKT